jgi:uncharacterized membrane-anchored protein
MRSALIFTFTLFLHVNMVFAQEPSQDELQLPDVNWIDGPVQVDIGKKAKINVPEGYDFLEPKDTTRLMEFMENPGSVNEYYLGPQDMSWFAIFSYEDTGHIKDDDELDADAILDSVREGTAISNVERRKRGWQELNIIGWQYKPFYEPETNRLAWAILAESEGGKSVNYNTRLLGRTGVITATLVADPDILDKAVKDFQSTLNGFSYNPGNRYSEYKPGDKTAAYGLAALVAGGAAAAVVKSGAGKGLIKAILIGGAAVLAAVGSAAKRLFGKKG